MTGKDACEAVMLIGFGGPTRAAEVRPFLDRVLAGRPVVRERYEEVVRHYEALGGRSPYNELTMRQAAAVQKRLLQAGADVPVIASFRHTTPSFDDSLHELGARGIRRVFGFILAPHRSEVSWDRYIDQIRASRERLGPNAPEVKYPSPWHDQTEFIEAVADRARAALDRLDRDAREQAELIFTAHSIPISIAGRASYVEQLKQSARLIAQNLGRRRWTLAFQSRSGGPPQSWLGPDIAQVLRLLHGGCAVVIPVGFLCDHIEVLYDLDVDAGRIARDAGVTMERAATVGDHPKFIEMIARLARPYLSPAAVRSD